jgi:hypothetical protein
MKILLRKLNKELGYEVDIEESPKSKLNKLTVEHDAFVVCTHSHRHLKAFLKLNIMGVYRIIP